MVNKPLFRDFFKNGYFVYKIKNLKDLNTLKISLLENSKKILGIRSKKNFFNKFHDLNLSKKEENIFRMKLMSKVNYQQYGSKIGYKIFNDIITPIFGQDVVTQKNINLVIQCPKDETQITVHRDAPPNSIYEIVIWLPMVDTYGSKNMKIVNKKNTEMIYKKIKKISNQKKNFNSVMKKYFDEAFQKSKSLKLKYGEALIFWTPLIHCVGKNKENETRWSLNFRYKNTFTPYGTKGLMDYFKVINSSTVTKLALEQEYKKFKIK